MLQQMLGLSSAGKSLQPGSAKLIRQRQLEDPIGYVAVEKRLADREPGSACHGAHLVEHPEGAIRVWIEIGEVRREVPPSGPLSEPSFREIVGGHGRWADRAAQELAENLTSSDARRRNREQVMIGLEQVGGACPAYFLQDGDTWDSL